jgi:hypothetical protein
MLSKKINLVLILVLLLSLSLACLVGGGESPAQQESSQDAIATSVAATIAAGQSGGDPASTEDPNTPETVAASVPQPNFNAAGVSLAYNNLLAESLSVGINPGNYEENNPWWSSPEHRELTFNDWVLSDAYHAATIRIYPVADFRAMNENVNQGLDALQLALDTQPADYAGLAVSDMFNAGQLYQSNVKYLDFQNGRGARWLAQYGQAYFSVGWPYLFYTYQGLTSDGLYYISMILPVNHPYLPNPDEVDLNDDFYENYGAYRDAVVAQLEAESENTFMPSLVLLDQMVESMTVGEP